MKRYKNLWEQFISWENLELAAKKAVKSKKNKKTVRAFEKNKTELLRKLQKSLIDGTFTTSRYKIRKIYEPKERQIYILPLYPDHIVHHALINLLGPIWQSTFIKDSYACIPGRGLHSASKRLMTFIRHNKYCLQCDIRKFYPSINHDIVFRIVKKKIADKRLLEIVRNVIYSCPGATNLPIGNLTSQWMGNVYMNELDHFVKEQLHCRSYIRYCDDFLLFGDDKKQLKQWRNIIEFWLWDNLQLWFSKSVIFPTCRGVTFIGYRHFRKFIILRKYSAKKMKKRILNIINHNDKSNLAVGQLAAFYGWAKWCCSYNFLTAICKRANDMSKNMGLFVKERLFLS